MKNAKICTKIAIVALAISSQSARASAATPDDFLTAVSQSDRYEELAATIAITQSNNSRVITFAQAMLRDHARLSNEMRQAAAAAGLAQPALSVSGDQAKWLASLQSAEGADFDEIYASQQALAHLQAVAVEESFVTDGTQPELEKTAQSDLPTIRDHLIMAQELSAALGG